MTAHNDTQEEDAPTEWLSFINELHKQWTTAKRDRAMNNQQHGVEFNPLSSISIKEIDHSKLLGNLLDPQGNHGQNGLFLQAFLRHLEVPNPTKGEWEITIEVGRVDIMLKREDPAALIIIENKANGASDGDNQLYRYWHEQAYEWKREHPKDETSHSSFRLIYMPAADSKKPAAHSLERPSEWTDKKNPYKSVPLQCEQLTVRELITLWEKEVLPVVDIKNKRIHTFLEFYSELFSQQMNEQPLLNQSIALFDSPEKWDSICELSGKLDEIAEQWLITGTVALHKSFANDPNWECKQWGGPRDISWLLKGKNRGPLRIGMGWQEVEFHFYLQDFPNSHWDKAKELIKRPQYSPLLEFLQMEYPSNQEGYHCLTQNHNYPFSKTNTSHPKREQQLQWTAAHKTEEYVDKMGAFIRQLTDNQELTALFCKLDQDLKELPVS